MLHPFSRYFHAGVQVRVDADVGRTKVDCRGLIFLTHNITQRQHMNKGNSVMQGDLSL